MSEMALVSARKSRLEELAKQGNKSAQIALKLLQHPERFLSTVQIGITLIGIVVGAYGAETFAPRLSPLLDCIGIPTEYSYNIAYGIVISILTYLSIIIGELVPKAIAITYAERITLTLAPFMQLIAILTRPFVWLLSVSTKGLLKMLGIKEKQETPVTEEELKMLIEQSAMHGAIEQQETDLIKSIFRFGDRRAYAIMTSRQDTVWLDLNDSVEEIRQQIYSSNYTKFPVCDGDMDKVLGILAIKDFLKAEKESHIDIKGMLTKVVYVPENLMAFKIFELFREKRTYIGIVVDEFGSTIGLITMHDLVESIFGDLPDEDEQEEPDIVEREDGSMFIEGSMQIDELRETLRIPAFDNDDEDGEYATLGGFMMYKLNRVPHTGDKFDIDGYSFEVVDMDGHRVDKVLVTQIVTE